MAHGKVETTGGTHHQEGGPPMGWHRELLIGFDLETTGTDPREARIVTGAVIEVRGGEPIGRREWLADPGVADPGGRGRGARHQQRARGRRGPTRRPGRGRDRRRPRRLLEDGRAGRRLQRGLRPDPALRRAAPVRTAVPARPPGRHGPRAGHRPVHHRPLGRPLPPRQAQPRSGLHGVRRRPRLRPRRLGRRPRRGPAGLRDSRPPPQGRRPRPGGPAPPPDRVVRGVGGGLPELPAPQGRPGRASIDGAWPLRELADETV